MDHIQREIDSNLFAVEEALSTVSKQEDDLEWKQFIQKELGKLEIQVKDGGKEESEKTSSAGPTLNLSTLIEKLPLEKLVVKVVQIVKTTMEQKKTESEKTKSEKTKSKKTVDEKDRIREIRIERIERNERNERNERIRRRKNRRKNRIEKTDL